MQNDLPSHRHSSLTIIAASLGAFAALVLIAFALTPLFLSSAIGNRMLVKMISNQTGLKIQADAIYLSWIGHQEAKGITLQKPDSQLLLTCSEISCDAPLWKLLFQKDLDTLTLTGLNARLGTPLQRVATPLTAMGYKLYHARPETWNFERAKTAGIDDRKPVDIRNMGRFTIVDSSEFSRSSKSKFQAAHGIKTAGFAAVPSFEYITIPTLKLPFKGKIFIEDAKVEITSIGIEPIFFDQLKASMQLMPQSQITLSLSCTTQQQQTQGMLSLQGSASLLNSSFPKIAMQASATQLPVRGIDQLAACFSHELNGLIYEALGSVMDAQCNFTIAEGNFDLSLHVQSPQVSAQLATQTLNGMVSLKNPAQFHLNLTPALLQKIIKNSPPLALLSLDQPLLLQGTLSQFCCPIPAQASDLLKSSFQLEVASLAQARLTLNGAPLFFNSLQFSCNSLSLEEEIAFSLSTALQTQSQSGSVALQADFKHIFSQNPTGSILVNADHLPTEWIGIALQSKVDLAALLGPAADLRASLQMTENNPTLNLKWNSQFLNVASLDLSLNSPWTLISPASFTIGFNPKLSFFDPFKISKAGPIQGTLQNLAIPANNIQGIRLNAVIHTEEIETHGALPLNISTLKATLEANTLDQISLEIEGSPLKASISGALKLSPLAFALDKPLTVQYTLDDPTLKAWAQSAPHLAKPALIQLSIDPTLLSIDALDLNQLSLKGELSTPEITLGSQGKMITLQNTTFPFQWDSKAKTASVQLASKVSIPKINDLGYNPSEGAGSIQAACSISNFFSDQGFDLNRVSIQAALELKNLSSTLLDAFSGKTALSPLIGPVFSGKIKLQSFIDKQNIAIQWASQYLNIESSFAIDNSAIQLQGDANQISWILTPDSYKIIDKARTAASDAALPFEISQSSTFTISLAKLCLPVIAKKEIFSLFDRIPDIALDLSKLQLNASASNPKLAFFDKKSKETIQFNNLLLSLTKSADKGPLTASLESGVLTQTGSANTLQSVKNGSFSLSGNLLQTLNDAGAFDISHLSGSLQAKIQQMPARALDLIARSQGRTDFPFTTIFGDMINASMKIDLKNFAGPLTLNINTPMTRVDLNGHLLNGALLLNDAIYAQTRITPEISRLILKEVNPLNLSYIYSQSPITLEIASAGFYFPLYPFSLGKIAIPEATIELGKIACRNEGNVNIALGLLKTKQFDKSSELNLWFAPIELSVKQGFAAIDRTEILLADTFDVCLWGSLDLVKHYVDMTLGLTAQTLSKAFGIKNLPENYVLTIPMKGAADNVQINTGKATTKVALLLAWQNKNIAGAFGGGPAGALVGEFLGKIATLPDSDAKVPPAKHPFPWEVGKRSKTSQAPHEKKRPFKSNEKPLKQILKLMR
jgi:hypothetical protein